MSPVDTSHPERFCACGATLPPQAASLTLVRCAVCGREVTAPTHESTAVPIETVAQSRGRDRRLTPLPVPSPDAASPSAPDSAPAVVPPKRGLWAIMGKPVAEVPSEIIAPSSVELSATVVTPDAAPLASDEPAMEPVAEAAPAPRKGLWQLMQRAAVDPPLAAPVPADTEKSGSTTTGAPLSPVPTSAVSLPPRPVVSVAQPRPGRFENWSLLWGGLAVLVAPLGIWPYYIARLPAGALGLAAILAVFLATSERRPAGGTRGRGWPLWVGGVCGLWGMFATELCWKPLDVYNRWCQAQTRSAVDRLSQGMQQYVVTHGTFPAGQTLREVPDADPLPLHSWMTQLLPHLPEGATLVPQLQMAEPFDAPVNAAAMRTVVPSFMAAGGPQDLIRNRFAVSHFAGVGGTVRLADGNLAQAGIFGTRAGLRRDEIVDGQAQTLILGEIATEYPAWGDPRNWRTVGKGLNRDLQGFGNVQDTGALFLMADGSVRFFSKRTDPALLRALSTRNGEEAIAPLE